MRVEPRFFLQCTRHPTTPFCPTWLRGTSLTCSIGCEVSSLVSTTPSCSDFSKFENHSSWLVMWCDASESTYHTTSDSKVVFFIELTMCFITKVGPFFGFGAFRPFSVVWVLSISLFGSAVFRFGFVRFGALLPALALLVALFATVPTFHFGLCLPVSGATLTPLACAGSRTTVGTTSLSSLFSSCRPPPLRADPPRSARPWGRSASMYNIRLSDWLVLDPLVWLSSTISIDCKSKKDGGFSRVHIVGRIGPYLYARPPRQIYTISSSSIVTLMDPNAS